MVSLIVLLVLVATINMPQAAAQYCAVGGGACDDINTCCSPAQTFSYNTSCTDSVCIDGICNYSPANC